MCSSSTFPPPYLFHSDIKFRIILTQNQLHNDIFSKDRTYFFNIQKQTKLNQITCNAQRIKYLISKTWIWRHASKRKEENEQKCLMSKSHVQLQITSHLSVQLELQYTLLEKVFLGPLLHEKLPHTGSIYSFKYLFNNY